MKTIQWAITIIVILTLACPAIAGSNPQVRLETTKGPILLELDPQAAPKTVDNFIAYVREGFYNGTIFHRVIKGFMIQGGGMLPGLVAKAGRDPIRNEAHNGLQNKEGTIAMARTSNPHSATSQFFINTKDNPFLDFKTKSRAGYGYCVFGRVVKGMEVVKRIEAAQTMSAGGHKDVPRQAIVIERAELVAP